MNKRYQLRIDILNMILRFMVTFTIVAMLTLLFTNKASSVWSLLILFQASVISLIIDKCTKRIWSFTLLHLLLIAFYFFLTGNLMIRVFYVIYILAYAITEFALNVKAKVRNTSIIFAVLFLAMYSVCRYSYPEEVALSRFFFILPVVYGLIYILNMYYINLYSYMQKHKDKINIPMKQIKSSYRVYVSAFIGLSLFSMLAFTKFPLEGLFRLIGKGIIGVLRFLFSGLKNTPPENIEPSEIPNIDIYNMERQNLIPKGRPDKFFEMLAKIVIVLLVAAFVAMVLIMLIVGIYQLYKRFYQKKIFDDEEKVEVISPFSKSSLSLFDNMRNFRKKHLNPFGKSNNDRIRKLFVKAVQKNTKPEQELRYDTPSELSKYAITPDKKLEEDMKTGKEEALTDLYEKARYSNEECSREEAQSVKELLKKP